MALEWDLDGSTSGSETTEKGAVAMEDAVNKECVNKECVNRECVNKEGAVTSEEGAVGVEGAINKAAINKAAITRECKVNWFFIFVRNECVNFIFFSQLELFFGLMKYY